ncbi:hypothetical protein C8J57DRAFT_1242933 [Mycena rebaudengoi]|nr:hypothetical protein C8J57DRAFT_1242933 [Mycena rebaudengoi]
MATVDGRNTAVYGVYGTVQYGIRVGRTRTVQILPSSPSDGELAARQSSASSGTRKFGLLGSQIQRGPDGRIRTYQVRIYHNMSEKGKKRVEEMSHHWTGSERDAESPMLQTSFLRCGMLVEEKVRRRAQIMSEWRQWRRLHATFGGCGEYLMFNSGGGGGGGRRGRLTSGATCSIWIPEVIFGHQGVSDDVRQLRMGHPFESRLQGSGRTELLTGRLTTDIKAYILEK